MLTKDNENEYPLKVLTEQSHKAFHSKLSHFCKDSIFELLAIFYPL
jgi:hypothetical protein